MKYCEITEGRDAPLYHAFRRLDYGIQAIKSDELLATSSQRFWADGKRRKDNDPDYENSFWMKGVSTTRDQRFAMSWGTVLFVLDQSKLQMNYRIIPFNWGFSIPKNNHHKREREEFIVRKATQDTYHDKQYPDDPDDLPPRFNVDRFQGPEGSIKPLSRYLTGIMVDEHYNEIESTKKQIEPLVQHRLFRGFYNGMKP